MTVSNNETLPSKMRFSAVAAEMMINNHVDFFALHEATGIEISDIVVKEICKANPSIQSLKLDSCHVLTDFSLVDVGRYCKRLEHISLRGCVNVKLVGLRSLAMNCRCLRSIDFEGYDIDDSGLRIIAASLNNLEYLNLTNCDSITDRGLSQIAHCCTKLKTLKLGGCYKIGESGIWAFYELENCPYLQEIELYRCIYVSNSALLSVAKRCPSLTMINISECSDIDTKAMMKFVKLNDTLRVLRASQCPRAIDDDVATELIQKLSNCLLQLDLSYCNLSEAVLQKASYCKHLKCLHLSGCPVSDEVISTFAEHLPNLELLEVFESLISNHGVQLLVPGDAGAGLSYLGLTGCPHVEEEFLHSIEAKFKFSILEYSEAFAGFKPRRTEKELRRIAQLKYDKLMGSILIQRHVRGMLVRVGEYRRRREEWAVKHGLLKLQGLYRGNRSRNETKKLLQEKKEYDRATRIASCFKGYRERTKFQKYLCVKRKEELEHTSSIMIQCSYRNFYARKILQRLKNDVLAKELKEKKELMVKTNASIFIQTLIRMYLAKNKLKLLKRRKELRLKKIALERTSAIAVQRVYRGLQGRRRSNDLRIHLRRIEEEWFRARQIQSLWRGVRDRKQFKQDVHMKELKLNEHMILTLQRVWRGFLGRRHYKFLKGLKDLALKEKRASIIIQKVYRGRLGRKVAGSEYERIQRQITATKSALLIQKVYRGFKARELAEITLGLKNIQDQTNPLSTSIDDLEKALNQERLRLRLSEDEIQSKNLELLELEKEFATVDESKALFIDSTIITGAPQRCAKEVVLTAIKSKIDQKNQEINSLKSHCLTITEKEHEDTKEVKRLKKRLSMLTSSTTNEIKEERLKRIRNGLNTN